MKKREAGKEKTENRFPCRQWTLYNRVTKRSTVWFCNSARCNDAKCQECWAKRRIAIADDLIKNYGLSRFFTLTISREYPLDICWDMISHWWSLLRKRIKRYWNKFGYEFKFFAVLECHNDGYPHIHGFWNVYIDVKTLSKMWSECAPGYRVDVRATDDSKGASDYLFKGAGFYIGKKQAIDAARRVEPRKRTMWRSKGLYTQYELNKKALDAECDPDYNRVWSIEKTNLLVMPVRERNYGDAQQKRQDMERTRESFPEESTKKCERELEAAETEGQREEETRCFAPEACYDKQGDKKDHWELVAYALDVFEGSIKYVCQEKDSEKGSTYGMDS